MPCYEFPCSNKSLKILQSTKSSLRSAKTSTTRSKLTTSDQYDRYSKIEAHTDVTYVDHNNPSVDELMIHNYFTVEEYHNQKQPIRTKESQNASKKYAAHTAGVLVVLIILVAVFVALTVVIVRRRSTLLKFVIPRLVFL